MENSSFSSLYNLPYSKDIHSFSQPRPIIPTINILFDSSIETQFNFRMAPDLYQRALDVSFIFDFRFECSPIMSFSFQFLKVNVFRPGIELSSTM